MRTNSIKHRLSFIAIFFLFSISIYSEEIEVGQSIKWKAVSGASGYKIDLEDDKGNAILSRNIENNSLQLELGVGKYRFRISVINKFKKIGRVYDWQQLIVKPIDAPKVKESPAVFNPKSSKKDFLVKGTIYIKEQLLH